MLVQFPFLVVLRDLSPFGEYFNLPHCQSAWDRPLCVTQPLILCISLLRHIRVSPLAFPRLFPALPRCCATHPGPHEGVVPRVTLQRLPLAPTLVQRVGKHIQSWLGNAVHSLIWQPVLISIQLVYPNVSVIRPRVKLCSWNLVLTRAALANTCKVYHLGVKLISFLAQFLLVSHYFSCRPIDSYLDIFETKPFMLWPLLSCCDFRWQIIAFIASPSQFQLYKTLYQKDKME